MENSIGYEVKFLQIYSLRHKVQFLQITPYVTFEKSDCLKKCHFQFPKQF